MRRPFILVTIAVYLVSSIPYLAGWAFQDSSARFTWIVFDVTDTAQYYAWMRAFSHDVVIANPLTPETGAQRFFNLQWWLLGVLAFKTPLGPTIVYQLLRIVALAGFAAALAWFCRLVVPRRAFLAFTLVMLSSGFGWALVALKQFTGELRYPMDVQIAEANAYFSAMAFPHLLVAAALLLAIFCAFLNATGPRRWRYTAIAGGLTLALGLSHGYDLVPAIAVPCATAAYFTLRDRRLSEYAMPAVAIVAFGAPSALYSLALTRLDHTWEGVLSQYDNAGVFSPSPPHLIILLGLPFLLALPQLRRRYWQDATPPQVFLRIWLVVGFFLLYIPTDYQVKMLIGYQVPACVLAIQTLSGLSLKLPRFTLAGNRFASAAAPALLIGFVLLTNLYLTSWRIVDLRRGDYPYYLSSSDVAVLEQLPEVVEPGDVVLSSPEVGVFVPVYSDARPFVAHWAQTLDFLDRRLAARWFYHSATSNSDRERMLLENDIDYVIAGPAEAQLSGVDQTPDLSLQSVMAGKTTLYRNPMDSSQR